MVLVLEKDRAALENPIRNHAAFTLRLHRATNRCLPICSCPVRVGMDAFIWIIHIHPRLMYDRGHVELRQMGIDQLIVWTRAPVTNQYNINRFVQKSTFNCSVP